jgi:hypothetical protein
MTRETPNVEGTMKKGLEPQAPQTTGIQEEVSSTCHQIRVGAVPKRNGSGIGGAQKRRS